MIIGIATAILIKMVNVNESQEWMERGLFRALKTGKRHQMFKNEMGQFEVAMRALERPRARNAYPSMLLNQSR